MCKRRGGSQARTFAWKGHRMHQAAAWIAKRILKVPCDYEAKANRNWIARGRFWHFVVAPR